MTQALTKNSVYLLDDAQLVRAFLALGDLTDCREFDQPSEDWTEAGPDIGEVLKEARETLEKLLREQHTCLKCFGREIEYGHANWRCRACDPLTDKEKVELLIGDIEKLAKGGKHPMGFEDARAFLNNLDNPVLA